MILPGPICRAWRGAILRSYELGNLMVNAVEFAQEHVAGDGPLEREPVST